MATSILISLKRGYWLGLPMLGCVLVVIVWVLLLLLPNKVIASLPLLKRLKAELLKATKRAAFLSTQGPFFKLGVWCGKRCSCGRLSSRPQPPMGIKAKATSAGEAILYWQPKLPRWNPFHEEQYVCSWRVAALKTEDKVDDARWHTKHACYGDMAGVDDARWHTKHVCYGDYEEQGKRRKMAVDALPESTVIAFRVAATNRWGRSDWATETTTRTLARPSDDGGFWGPLGAAAEDFSEERRRYRWVQQRGTLELKVPIPKNWRAGEFRFKHTPAKLELLHAPSGSDQRVLLAGNLSKRVKADEVFWQLDESEKDGRHIAITMTKEDPLQQWSSVFEGDEHPGIDPKYVPLLQDGMTENIDWLKENAHITRRSH